MIFYHFLDDFNFFYLIYKILNFLKYLFILFVLKYFTLNIHDFSLFLIRKI